MKLISLTRSNGQKIEILASNILRISDIHNEDYIARTRIELCNNSIELVLETINEIKAMME